MTFSVFNFCKRAFFIFKGCGWKERPGGIERSSSSCFHLQNVRGNLILRMFPVYLSIAESYMKIQIGIRIPISH